MIQININDWYWIAKTGSIYSSKRNALVYTYDYSYLAFLEQNGAASPWPVDTNGNQTSDALAQVLTFYGNNNTPPSP